MKIFIIKGQNEKEELIKIQEYLEDTRNQSKDYEHEMPENNYNNLMDSFQLNDLENYNINSDQDFFSH